MSDIAAMAVHLPPDSAVARAIRPPEPDDIWTLDAQLAALAVDTLGDLLALARATFEGKRRVSFPDPIPRPGVGPKEGTEKLDGEVFSSQSDFDAWNSAQPGGRVVTVASK
jgi:hypothetical protein